MLKNTDSSLLKILNPKLTLSSTYLLHRTIILLRDRKTLKEPSSNGNILPLPQVIERPNLTFLTTLSRNESKGSSLLSPMKDTTLHQGDIKQRQTTLCPTIEEVKITP